MDEMLKVYQKDIAILRMERRGLIKKLNENEKQIMLTTEYCNQIIEGAKIYES